MRYYLFSNDDKKIPTENSNFAWFIKMFHNYYNWQQLYAIVTYVDFLNTQRKNLHVRKHYET